MNTKSNKSNRKSTSSKRNLHRLEEQSEGKPTSQEVNTLASLFNQQRYIETENLARLMTAKFPLDGFCWKALSASLKAQGRDALTALQNAVELLPDDAEAHNNLGDALRNLGQLDNAVASFHRALKIKHDFAEACNDLGITQQDLGQLDVAVSCFHRALEIKPDFPEAHGNLGNVQRTLGQLEKAEASYRRAIELKPSLVDAHSDLGSILMEIGKMDEAELFLIKAIELAPNEARPLATALAYIPYQKHDSRFSQLETIYSQRGSLSLEDRIKLSFAMGKAMESLGQYDKSFSAYEEGNRLHYVAQPFNEVEEEHFIEKIQGFCTADMLKKCADLAYTFPPIQDERVPVFIVGMLRSGTTLIEQILSSHPAIYGAGELTTLDELIGKAMLLFLDYSDLKTALLALRKLGQDYLDHVWKLAPDAHYITDKLPGNYHYLGLIHLMLPNAKIIHSKRDPMDTCFSCYSLNFKSGHNYCYDLRAMGRQYLRYMKLMQYWHNVLPIGKILDVRYEYNVADPESGARRMLDYLGLPWDPACLKPHEKKRPVRTASVSQVRQPIYSTAVARWKRFEKHLGTLLEIILPAML